MKKALCNRFLSVLLALTVVFSLFGFSASAAGTDVVFEEKLEGNRLTVSVYVTDGAKLNIAEFELYYNSSVLYFNGFSIEGTDSSELKAAEKFSVSFNDFSAPPKFVGVFSMDLGSYVPPVSPMLSKFHIADLVFTVNPGAENSVKGTEIALRTRLMVDERDSYFDKKYSVNADLGKPSSAKKKMGDVDGDKSVTAADARIILRCAVGLENPAADVLAYANLDYDNAISAADARFALRTAVGLETVAQHAFSHSGNKYTCTECNKSFVLGKEPEAPAPHVHDYKFVDCYSPLECSCGETKGEAPLHDFDKATLTCPICGFDFQKSLNQITACQKYDKYITTYAGYAIDAYKRGSYSSCISYCMDVMFALYDQTETIKGNKDLEFVYVAFASACLELSDALLSITVNDKISPTYSNATVAILALDEAIDYILIGTEELGRVIEYYGLIAGLV